MTPRKLRLVALNIRSLWNVGSFFRTADAFTVEQIYLAGYTATPPRKEIEKTALGAQAWIPWEALPDPMETLQKLKSEGWQLVALELSESAVELKTFKPGNQVCLIVGNEISGVPEEITSLCDYTVQIPMLGQKESLNVAVATGIALHHLRTA
jgi:23S rRNA (guanosine2251-2'-O)-methyltransferase